MLPTGCIVLHTFNNMKYDGGQEFLITKYEVYLFILHDIVNSNVFLDHLSYWIDEKRNNIFI